ncbi:hypothetical protein [Winogradskya humida]|uniref:Uncharacterized protein n=1 Tax=Winogradskya humida TaxID=113566 RepID=A0ABQ4A2B6_9ACTN|nr:hypothetical protein [Actinoplanes humidus]GIE24972.1 hypothetical protein Ahu01nite_080740 [Actinoplanes humidus]
MRYDKISQSWKGGIGMRWYSVAGGAPELSGAVPVTSGPLASLNGFEDDALLKRTWSYTGRVLSATVDINRADPDADSRGALTRVETVSRMAEHLVVPLSGIGDGGLAVLDHTLKGADHPLVRAYFCSGNAYVSVLMHVAGVIDDEAGLTAHAGELIAALHEVLDDLRPPA